MTNFGPKTLSTQFWSATPPGAGSPQVAVSEAIAVMQLRAVQIGMAPPAAPGSMGIVNLHMWMWAADPGPHTTGPITASASAGGTSVTATGKLDKIVWDMGDGHTVTCTGPGTRYEDKFGQVPSPDCGYVYDRSSATQPHKTYTVTATSYWTVTWSGAGDSGTIPLTMSRTIDYPVGEIQALNIPDDQD